LTARGFRYVPDPMGRVGWGDWVDAAGKMLDSVQKREIVKSEIASRDSAIGGKRCAARSELGSFGNRAEFCFHWHDEAMDSPRRRASKDIQRLGTRRAT
jgi:hypothetical protein